MLKKVFFEITNVCNLSCPFCPPTRRPPCFIQEAAFEKVLREVVPLTERVLLHVKGEPLLHPGFPEFIRLGQAMGGCFEITTNGLFLSGQQEILRLPAVAQVNFSLHALLANEVEDVAGKVEAILAFAETSERMRPDLYINFRFWDLAVPAGSPQNPILEQLGRMYGFSPQNVDVKRKKSFRLSGRTYVHFDTEFRWPSMEDPEIGEAGFCYGLRSQIGILSDGTVTPCCLDAEGDICLGNVFAKSLPDILRGARAEALLRHSGRYVLSEPLCRRCAYARRFSMKTLGKKKNM